MLLIIWPDSLSPRAQNSPRCCERSIHVRAALSFALVNRLETSLCCSLYPPRNTLDSARSLLRRPQVRRKSSMMCRCPQHAAEVPRAPSSCRFDPSSVVATLTPPLPSPPQFLPLSLQDLPRFLCDVLALQCALLPALEIYISFLHPLIWGRSALEFLPLMLVSVFSAFGVAAGVVVAACDVLG